MKAESKTPLNRNDLLRNWREMSDMEKAPFIKAVSEDYESLRERRISKEEQKILDSYNGIPVKPMHPFNEFIKDFQLNYHGESKERFREASVAWKNMNSEDKQKYLDLAEAKTEIYRQDLETYVSGLPSKEREETWIKLRLSKKMKRGFNPNDSMVKEQNGSSKDAEKKSEVIKPTAAPSKSNKAVSKAAASAKKEQTDDLSKKEKVPLKAPAIPEKFKKFEESDDSSRKRKAVTKVPASPEKSSDDSSKKRQKNKLYNESEEEAETARKKFKTEKEVTTDSDSRGSPKKKKKKETRMLQPSEYPSQTKQHYFLTHVYKGALDKPEKINAAWLRLSKSEKKKIIDKVADNQKSYLKIVKDFVANNDRQDVEIFKNVAKDCQAEQNKAIAWCKNMNSDSSSDSDDSDSS